GVELSAHALCAQDHLPYQGKQFSNGEYAKLQARLKRPIGMWNCRHMATPILLGISQPAYTPEQLRRFEENSREKIEIDGVSKTRYEWSQEQRKIETAIRWQKDAANLARASGDDPLRRECQDNVRRLNRVYDRVTDKAGLRAEKERMRVDAAGANARVNLQNPRKFDTIELEDIQIYRSLGAKAMNYEVKDLKTGEKFKLVEGTRIRNVEVFAGKGAKTEYRDGWKYANKHGGKPEDWQHVKGFGTLETDDGDRQAEIHWSRCDGIGNFEHFIKRWID
ncbi:MAG: hypothetical protein Q4D04_05515, partial [Clostridia bacterium]|nr:hypothetical protein [Clostridia bacterium]